MLHFQQLSATTTTTHLVPKINKTFIFYLSNHDKLQHSSQAESSEVAKQMKSIYDDLFVGLAMGRGW